MDEWACGRGCVGLLVRVWECAWMFFCVFLLFIFIIVFFSFLVFQILCFSFCFEV